MYEGAKLSPFFHPGTTKDAAHKMAARGGKALADHTREKTPVDTGHLLESWREKPVLIGVDDRGQIVHESGVYTEVSYAPDVEYGTGLWGPKHAKYLIEPKNPGGVLHWINSAGESVFARRVWHPGSPGAHMIAISVAVTEAEMHLLMEPILEEWAKETEAVNGARAQAGHL